ncbi:mycofactocin biosynthesis glycosyltransferase MftF [Nocardioides houyundeii]|uniref:mycofactocin biosynthesis glycosyltransferase MftF n=1 Tax=Nocardioides houyundeii TaxID=2045452 RepID=UPI000C780E7E|nr:mycofactocin biosynthesis glycosyltransferase MftF [Nocardioides houyundeii]
MTSLQAPAPARVLPAGFVVELDPAALVLDRGRLLVGGSPLTVMRLADAARARLVGDRLVVTDAASAEVAERLLATNLARPVPDASAEVAVEDLTVVVPVRDRPAQLDRCLTALGPLSVVVVDDASRDPAAVAAVARRHGAAVVALETNLGPAGARNAGLAQVTTPVVAFVDSDVQASAADLLRLSRHLADPTVAMVGPRVAGHVPRADPRWFERYDAAASSLSLGPKPYAVRPGAGVAWLPSACLVARTDHLGAGFDTDLRVGEDVDLVWRLVGAGRRVRYEPAVTVRHDVRPTVRGWLGRKVLYGSGGAGLAQRHGAHVAPAVLSPTLALAGAAALLRSRWSLPVLGAAAVHASVSVARALPADVPLGTRARVSGTLAVKGVGWSVRQESALLLRHWWPLGALACCFAPGRRAVATALVVDSVVAATEHRDADLDLATLVLGRRLDDLAYGTGLWWGAVRGRSPAALRPRRPGASRAPRSGQLRKLLRRAQQHPERVAD